MNATNPAPETIGKRYILYEVIGAGGMGAVYRAEDRMTGQIVALKRVNAPTEALDFGSHSDHKLRLVALTEEFRTLASLRHPNIVSVFDYGFDTGMKSFFTMEYLPHAQTILQASRDLSQNQILDLVIQMLQALVYLHRHGILHRDLKPGNVLVVAGQVKVVDFGLSVKTKTADVIHQTQSTGGTLAYMAPELFREAPVSRASDLYSVGVIAYELLMGHHPFNTNNLALLVNDILNKEPDLTSAGLDLALEVVLSQLLTKSESERYKDAALVIHELCRAAGIALPSETTLIRESFLQAAKFVGREREIAYFSTALDHAKESRGSAIMIGGESGVGKSRLLEEVRTMAMVNEALVLRAQAVSERIGSYHMWRDVLRHLAILSDVSDAEAALLQLLVPDIAAILERQIPPSPVLEPQIRQKQLFSLISELFHRQNQAILLIVEDVHWAGTDSLALLNHLSRAAADLRLLLIASYRSDEYPELTAQLPTMSVFKLARLNESSIFDLSAAILGDAGRDPRLIELLSRETEGNAFFLVEVMRSLAENAGQLSRVASGSLPETIRTGGIQQIIENRLAHLPADVRPLLQMAAVLGRELEPALLKVLDSTVDVDQFLVICANASVIEVQENRWRFAHDKLREQTLATIAEAALPSLHQRAAQAIEAAGPETSERAATLAYHWGKAHDSGKELHYATLAGRQALRDSAYADSVAFLTRALDLLQRMPESLERNRQELELLIDLGTALVVVKGSGSLEAQATYSRAVDLAQQLGASSHLFTAQWGLWYFHTLRAEHKSARKIGEELLVLAKQTNNRDYLLQAHHSLWANKFWLGEIVDVREHTQAGIALYNIHEHRSHMMLYGAHDPCVCGHVFASVSSWLLGYPEQARQQRLAGLRLAELVDHPHSTALCYALSAVSQQFLQEAQELLASTEIAINLSTKHGFLQWRAFSVILQGWARVFLGDEDGLAQMRQGLAEAEAVAAKWGRSYFLWILADAYSKLAQNQDSLTNLDAVQTIVEQSGEHLWESEMLRLRAELLLRQRDNIEQAEALFHQAIAVSRRHQAKSLELRASIALARFWSQHGKHAQAYDVLSEIYAWFSEGFDTSDLREAKTLMEMLA